MSRARIIKPEFFTHAELYDAEAESGLPLRVAFAGLWTVADREGRFPWRREVKLKVLPYDPVDFLVVLDALERFGFVRSYTVEGKRYGIVPTLGRHQHFNIKEQESKLPGPPPEDEKHRACTVPAPCLHRTNTPEAEAEAEAEAVLTAVRAKPPRATRRELVATPDEQAVFAHYKARHPLSRPGGNDQIRVVRRALAEGYTVAELCEAIDGNADEPWSQAHNKHELSFVLRGRDAIDRYRRDYQTQAASGLTPDGGLSAETLRLLGTA